MRPDSHGIRYSIDRVRSFCKIVREKQTDLNNFKPESMYFYTRTNSAGACFYGGGAIVSGFLQYTALFTGISSSSSLTSSRIASLLLSFNLSGVDILITFSSFSSCFIRDFSSQRSLRCADSLPFSIVILDDEVKHI